MNDVNKDETLVLSSVGEVLQVNKRAKCFYQTLRNIVERTYRHTLHLQYKNQSTDSKNQVIHKLHEVFPNQWSMRYARLAITKTYNNKKKSFKIYYY